MTTAIEDGAALLQAIIDDPGDDLPRMAYADWCEEHGQGERAEFVRVQIQIARLKAENGGEPLRCARCGTVPRWHSYTPRCRGQACRLRQREYYSGRRHIGLGWREGIPQGFIVAYGRGFPAVVTGHTRDWKAHGKAIVAAYPIIRVDATDKRPSDGTVNCWPPRDGHGWYRASVAHPHEPNALAAELWDLLEGWVPSVSSECWKLYATRDDANAARASRARDRAAKEKR